MRRCPFIFRVLPLPFAAAAGMILLLACWILPPQAFAQTITVGSVSGQAGTAVDLKINFTAGAAGVATLHFDLAFSPSLSMVSTTTGSAATGAGKNAIGSAISGGVRVLIFGLNQNPIGSGEVAIIRLNIAAGTPPGTIAVAIGNIVASDALGINVAASGTGGSVTVSKPSDTTAPVISAVAASGISISRATITWTTNEASDSQVEYGTTIAYGRSTVLNSSLVTSHSQTLTGLSAGTTYHYRVRSQDASGNLAVSDDFIFRTGDAPGDIVPVATLFYPRLLPTPTTQPGSPNEEFIGFGITNLDSMPARLRFTAYDIAGTAVTGPGISNPAVCELLPGEQLPLVDNQIFGSGFFGPDSMGWVKIESTSARVAGFFMMFNACLTEFDGANVTSNPLTSFIYPEIDARGFTKVSIANPNPDPATLTLDLIRSDGTVQSSATRNVPANGSLAADLFADIFPGSNPTGDGYVSVTSNQGVLPFELVGKATQYVGNLNGQDAAQGAMTLYCPQYVFGETWHTTLSVVNLDSRPGTVTFRFIRDDAPLMATTKVVPIDARGKIYVDDAAFFQSSIVAPGGALRQGYVEIVSTDVHLAGSVVFGDPERTAFASALPLVSTLDQSFLFGHLASSNQYFTGVAMLNPGPLDAAVDVEIYRADGTLEMTTKVLVPPRQRVARLLTDVFPELEGQQRTSGYFKLVSTQPLATSAFFGTRNLSALSAIPPQVR